MALRGSGADAGPELASRGQHASGHTHSKSMSDIGRQHWTSCEQGLQSDAVHKLIQAVHEHGIKAVVYAAGGTQVRLSRCKLRLGYFKRLLYVTASAVINYELCICASIAPGLLDLALICSFRTGCSYSSL